MALWDRFTEQRLVQWRCLNPALGSDFSHLWIAFLRLPRPITNEVDVYSDDISAGLYPIYVSPL